MTIPLEVARTHVLAASEHPRPTSEHDELESAHEIDINLCEIKHLRPERKVAYALTFRSLIHA
jgi:hypothetical protein